MINITRFINELMSSNCYIVWDDITMRCIVIDPGSEKSKCEIEFIENRGLCLDYIIITHEHTDHNWGVNALRERFSESKFICSENCQKKIAKTNKAYFSFYYDRIDYVYEIKSADILISADIEDFIWNGKKLELVQTPGHSYGSMCINLDNYIFTGDTIMPYRPYFKSGDGNKELWLESINKLKYLYSSCIMVFPGHGESLKLRDWLALWF